MGEDKRIEYFGEEYVKPFYRFLLKRVATGLLMLDPHIRVVTEDGNIQSVRVQSYSLLMHQQLIFNKSGEIIYLVKDKVTDHVCLERQGIDILKYVREKWYNRPITLTLAVAQISAVFEMFDVKDKKWLTNEDRLEEELKIRESSAK